MGRPRGAAASRKTLPGLEVLLGISLLVAGGMAAVGVVAGFLGYCAGQDGPYSGRDPCALANPVGELPLPALLGLLVVGGAAGACGLWLAARGLATLQNAKGD